MEPLHIATAIGSLIALGVSILAYIRQGGKDSTDAATKVTALEQKVASLQEIISAYNLGEFAAVKQSVNDLRSRVEKLDEVMEQKIEKVSSKIDNLNEKITNLLIAISKQNKDV
jgi:Na+/phosphate symporter